MEQNQQKPDENMIEGAYWSRDVLGNPNDHHAENDELSTFEFGIFNVETKTNRKIKIWAHDRDEAMDIVESEDTDKYTTYHHPGQTVQTNSAKNVRLVTLVLNDQDGLTSTVHIINIKTTLTEDKIIPAIRAACRDYLATDEGRKTYERNCHCFNYGDFDLYVSNKFCVPHAFRKLENDTDSIVTDNFNAELSTPD